MLFTERREFATMTPEYRAHKRRNMDLKERPIGVFDSGVGGISTLRAMTGELPQEHFLYYGDMANAPYGTKSPEEVLCAD